MKVYWTEECETGVPPGNAWLSAAETAVLEQLHVPKRRADWRLGRWTAKRAIAARLGIASEFPALAAIEVLPQQGGAPAVSIDGRPLRLAISLSHSSGTAFCAVADSAAEIGCDLERVEPRGDAFLADYFTPREQALLAHVPADFRAKALTLFWSAKESALKLLRCGLRADTRSVTAIVPELPPPSGSSWHPLAVRHSERGIFYGWWRDNGGWIWTILSAPPPPPPIAAATPVARAVASGGS